MKNAMRIELVFGRIYVTQNVAGFKYIIGPFETNSLARIYRAGTVSIVNNDGVSVVIPNGGK